MVTYDDDKSESVVGHFVADVSNFTSDDNPRLRNTDGVFQIWKPEKWNTQDSLIYNKHDGTLTVTKPGIYYIYAQVIMLCNLFGLASSRIITCFKDKTSIPKIAGHSFYSLIRSNDPNFAK